MPYIGDEVEAALKAIFPQFRWSDLRVIRELSFFEEDDDIGRLRQCVRLVIETDDYPETLRCEFLFVDVSGLEVHGLGGGVARVVGFDVTSIVERQWEGLRWEIDDVEEGDLRMRCREIEMRRAEVLGARAPPERSST